MLIDIGFILTPEDFAELPKSSHQLIDGKVVEVEPVTLPGEIDRLVLGFIHRLLRDNVYPELAGKLAEIAQRGIRFKFSAEFEA